MTNPEINSSPSTDAENTAITDNNGKGSLEALLAYGRRNSISLAHSEWLEQIAELKTTYAMNYDRDSTLIQPNYVIETVNKITRGEAIISTNASRMFTDSFRCPQTMIARAPEFFIFDAISVKSLRFFSKRSE